MTKITDMLAQQGQITTISWEDGSKVECGLEDCPCPAHEEAAPPRGTYVTVRLDDPNTELRLTRVSVVPVADIAQQTQAQVVSADVVAMQARNDFLEKDNARLRVSQEHWGVLASKAVKELEKWKKLYDEAYQDEMKSKKSLTDGEK